jgi:tRNA(Ile)-lysidine synthase
MVRSFAVRRHDLLAKIEQFMSQLAAGREKGIVAVSGGPDSVALAHLLAALRREGKTGPLVVAHLNHQLRGAESDGDEAFVKDLAGELGGLGAEVRFRSTRVEVAALARESRDNLESAARQARYEWFTKIAWEEGARWVATGHTADDQAETILHRLLRGTGLHGLAGIPARRELAPGIDVIRPLLRIRRTEVLELLEAEQQPFRIDSSNADMGFTRNRIRRELLPELARDYNPGIVSLLCRLGEQAGEVQDLIELSASELLRSAELPRAGNLLILQHAPLAAAPRHLLRELFRLLWRREGWPAAAMGFEDWERLACLVHGEEHVMDMPDHIRVRRSGRVVQMGPH